MPINGFPGQVISATAPTVSTAGATGIWGLDEQLQYAGQNLWPGYQISRSVRTRTSASAYFSRTPSAAGSRTTWTYSTWIKRGGLNSGYALFGCGANNTNDTICYFGPAATGDQMDIIVRDTSTIRGRLTTTPVYRDPGSWYHVVVVWDSGNATSGDRLRLYFNGVRVTAFSTETQPSQYTQSLWNSTQAAYIARMRTDTAYYFDGYMTEINFIDGQALDPSSFGINNALTGVWSPIKYAGTYGSNGFYLNFSDNSAATAAAIGKDSSGNGNNWTPNNISVTAGATYDSMVDVPVQYGGDTGVGAEVRGNYCVMNPVAKSSRVTIANANLQLTGDNTANHQMTYGTFPLTTGKWYWEVVVNNPTTSTVNIVGIQSYIGFADGTSLGGSGTGIGWGYTTTLGNFYSSNFTVSGSAPALANGTIGIAYDADAGKIWFRNTSGSWVQGDPAAGTSPTGTLSGTATAVMPAVSFYNSNGAWSFNFGQQAFSYTAPSGYKALCTANITAPTIPNGASYMAATTYAGSGASQSFTNTVNNVSFQPDFVWVKNRSSVTNNYLWDSVRGALKELYSNLTSAEATNTIGLSAFNSNGFTLNNGDAAWNASGSTYVGWQWKAGAGSSSSNTNGSITSTVSVNQTAGFSVVTYTGNQTAGATVGHGLGIAPSMVIAKYRGGVGSWAVYHSAIGATNWLLLNSTNAQTTSAQEWNNTAPTSTVFSVGNSSSNSNQSGTYVAYCFAPIAGYSTFGSYTGNGSADGPMVFTNMRPRFVLIKSATGIANWWILDTSRNTYNVTNTLLTPSNTYADDSTYTVMDVLSNGFKLRTTYTSVNNSGDTYIYAAFAENPFKFSLAR